MHLSMLLWIGALSLIDGVHSVGIMHDGLHIVAGEEAGDAVADALEPAVVVLLDEVDDGALHERQLVVLVLAVVINRDD